MSALEGRIASLEIFKKTELPKGAAVLTVRRPSEFLLKPFQTFAIISSSKFAQHLVDHTTEAGALHAHQELDPPESGTFSSGTDTLVPPDEDPLPDAACLFDQTKRARAAASTYDAVLYALRHDGETALARQIERLSEFSVGQLESLIVALKRLGACENLLLSLAELLP